MPRSSPRSAALRSDRCSHSEYLIRRWSQRLEPESGCGLDESYRHNSKEPHMLTQSLTAFWSTRASYF